MTVARITMLILLGAICVQMAFFYPQVKRAISAAQPVPARAGMVASHFNGEGEPNGEQTLFQFFGTYAVIVVMSAGLFLGVPLLMGRLPAEYFNLPNGKYWLAPERRAKTLAHLNDRFNWLGVATLSFVLVVMQAVLTANLSQNPVLPGYAVWLPLAAYGAFLMWWIVRLFGTFARIPEGSP